jgi:CYTH domain-containing protein
MPIENEVKFLLKPNQALEAKVRNKIPGQLIRQGYLSNGTRIRETVADERKVRHEFTHKEETAEGLVEIETEIGDTDFRRLWENTTNRLIKYRCKLKTDLANWDLDFLGGLDDPYIVLIEAEMPEEETNPGPLPIELSGCDFLAVGKDPRFLNWRLADKGFAQEVLREMSWHSE